MMEYDIVWHGQRDCLLCVPPDPPFLSHTDAAAIPEAPDLPELSTRYRGGALRVREVLEVTLMTVEQIMWAAGATRQSVEGTLFRMRKQGEIAIDWTLLQDGRPKARYARVTK